MANHNIVSYNDFLLAKMQKEVKIQIEKNNQLIIETKELIARCEISILELKYYIACTSDYLGSSVPFQPQNHEDEVESAMLIWGPKSVRTGNDL